MKRLHPKFCEFGLSNTEKKKLLRRLRSVSKSILLTMNNLQHILNKSDGARNSFVERQKKINYK